MKEVQQEKPKDQFGQPWMAEKNLCLEVELRTKEYLDRKAPLKNPIEEYDNIESLFILDLQPKWKNFLPLLKIALSRIKNWIFILMILELQNQICSEPSQEHRAWQYSSHTPRPEKTTWLMVQLLSLTSSLTYSSNSIIIRKY